MFFLVSLRLAFAGCCLDDSHVSPSWSHRTRWLRVLAATQVMSADLGGEGRVWDVKNIYNQSPHNLITVDESACNEPVRAGGGSPAGPGWAAARLTGRQHGTQSSRTARLASLVRWRRRGGSEHHPPYRRAGRRQELAFG
jgi:hypothetical protein